MKRSILSATTIIALSLTLLSARAGHCNDIFLFSGVDAGGGNRQGLNLGAQGCTSPAAHAETNYLTPGMSSAWAAAGEAFAPSSGTARLDGGAPIALTFTLNDLRGRWESQTFGIAGAAEVVLRITGATGVQTSTYTSL